MKGAGEGYAKVARRGVLWSLLRDAGGQFIAIPSAMVLARLLSPEEFGITAAANFFYLLANRVGQLGLNAAIIRIKTLRDEHMSSVFVVGLSAGCLVALAMALASPSIAAFYRSPETGQIVRVASLNFVIIPLGSVSMALINRNMRFRTAAQVDILAELVFSSSALVMAWNGYSFWSLVYAQLLANTAQTAAKLTLGGWRPSVRFSRHAFGEVFAFGAGVYAKRLLDYSAQNIDSLTVGRVLGMTGLGYYDRAFNTMQRFQERLTVAPGVSFRIFALIQDEPDRFRRGYAKVLLTVSLLGFPVFAALFVLAPHFLAVLFGERWLPAALPLRILSVVGLLKLMNTYGSSAIQASGRIWAEVWRQLLYGFMIVSGIIAFQRFGPTGAALGVLGATLVMTMLMQGLVRHVTGMHWRQILAPLTHGALCAGLVAVTLSGVHLALGRVEGLVVPHLVHLVTEGALAALVLFVFIMFNRAPDVRTLVREALGDVSPRLVRVWDRLGPTPQPIAAPPLVASQNIQDGGARLRASRSLDESD